MTAKALPRVREQTGSPMLDRTQARRNDVADAVNRFAIPPEAQLIRDVTIAAGSSITAVPHKLRRAYQNWLFVRLRGGAALGVYEAVQTSNLNATQISFANDPGAPQLLVDLLIW